MNKTAQLQIRVSPEQKKRIKSKAKLAGEDESQWALRRLLPECADEQQAMIDALGSSSKLRSQMLAELHDYLVPFDSAQLGQAFNSLNLAGLARFESNYVAAMIETPATTADSARRNRSPPLAPDRLCENNQPNRQ